MVCDLTRNLPMLTLIFSFLTIAAPSLPDLIDNSGWEAHKKIRAKKIGFIVVLKKKISGYECYRAQSNVKDVLFERLVEVSKDIPAATQWSSSGVTESVLLSHTDNVIDYYQYLKVPVLTDRHWFLRGQIQEEEGLYVFGWERIPVSDYTDDMNYMNHIE